MVLLEVGCQINSTLFNTLAIFSENLSGELKLPVHFIGMGEKADDLQTFDSEAFVDALTSN